jgi:hypothetical protein
MSDDAYFEQQKRIATARGQIADAMAKSEERDIAIWIAALIESLQRVSNWNLEVELK